MHFYKKGRTLDFWSLFFCCLFCGLTIDCRTCSSGSPGSPRSAITRSSIEKMEKRTNSRLLGFFQSRWRDEQESPPPLHPPQSVKTLSLSDSADKLRVKIPDRPKSTSPQRKEKRNRTLCLIQHMQDLRVPSKNWWQKKRKAFSRLSRSIVPFGTERDDDEKFSYNAKVKTEMMGKYGPWAKCWLLEFL